MRRICIAALTAVLSGIPAFAQEPATITFQRADGPGWGGQTLVAPRPLYLTTKATARVTLPLPKDTTFLYGKLEKTTVVQARQKDGTIRVFLDKDSDGRLTAEEGVTLQKGVVRWPACSDDLSALVQLRRRTAVVWACRAPNVLFWAYRGFLKGNVTIGGATRPAFLVDGNADGKFGEDKGDLLWIDRDGNGKLDPITEQFPCAPVLRIGNEIFRFAFTNEINGGTAAYNRVERGIAHRKVAFTGDLGTRIIGISATLLSQADDITRMETLGQNVEMPAGNYALTSLELRASATSKPGDAWTYAFSRTIEGKDAKQFPLVAEPGEPAAIALYDRINFGIRSADSVKPGEELSIQLTAMTELGLELNNVRRAGQAEYSSPEDFATIILLDAEGKKVGETHTGFA